MAGAVQMIAGSVKVAQEQKWALIALNSMGMVSNVLNDVLFLTKIEEGRVVMHKQTFSVLGMAEEMRFMFSEQAKQNNLELRVLPPQGVHDFVVGDKNRLNEVLANFCSNAIKFTSTGSVTLEVKQEAEDDKHVDLVIQVTDTGRGLSSDDVVNLFEPFRTLADSRSRTMGANAKGTGLGLVICKHIIRAHGGEVFVHSAGAGKGSTFGFKIMLEKGNPDEALKSSWHIPDASSGVDQYGEPDPQPTDLDESPQIGDRHKRTPSEDFYSWREFNADAPSPREPELEPEQPEPEVLRTPLAKCGGSLRGLSSWDRVHVARTRTTDDALRKSLSSPPPPDIEEDFAVGDVTRILVVDDDEFNVEIVSDMLQSNDGWTCDIASNGVEALKRMGAHCDNTSAMTTHDNTTDDEHVTVTWPTGTGGVSKYACVVTDQMMPVMGGRQLARELRACSGPPVIGLTGSAQPEDITKCREAGMGYVLSKPVQMQQLVDTVTSAISGHDALPGT